MRNAFQKSRDVSTLRAMQNLRGHPANKPHFAIPAKAGIQHMKRALRAPFKAGAGRQSPQCARTARYLHWIPACAGMAEKRGGNGFYTDCFFRRNDKEGGRNDEEGYGNGGGGLIRWVPTGFAHSLLRGNSGPYASLPPFTLKEGVGKTRAPARSRVGGGSISSASIAPAKPAP